ncbi:MULTISPECIES: DUF3000 domain-containing protein [Streptomycetaceae]|uniref:DUF3000 domain-containing protein n=1 Tax=Streptantibioticus cattleyicolor (strain ATCC 35852 / DSM 46488 / JCM 4925 / NBRC 14057 / NRRL 8057) TaxID=1003195 RepID=F8JWQ2_STREN|nr:MULTISPECIES: DUF3000 domain-containing protein [Streptomycetaceae]AEW97050.1 hypothetical protein SCATT_46790 [Streptantibioticus cattleyicolor NRRL 8057 = DSM 46488]MYS61515.1 DUF3000 family protein [Streptomyces sp. SID5468]CCB77375.1 conserved protein of unknown function [Streptantibioticus cattleyicolor NRRL 8057 = DSM 46488]
MAVAQGHLADEDGGEAPPVFRQAVDALRTARVRAEVELSPMPAPKRLAPHAYALEAAVVVEGEELADGRLILLHDPAGHEAWHGAFRVVTLARAELEPEMAADPLLPEVCWSWLTGALDARGAGYAEAGGTVSRSSSHHFGALADRPDTTEIEVRASWTPGLTPAGAPDVAAHLAAWCEFLCTSAGLPPAQDDQSGGIVSLPKRRGPR